MEQITYTDLSSIKQFSIARHKMSAYLDTILDILKKDLTGFEYIKLIDHEDEEFILKFNRGFVEISFGFTWADDVNLAVEINLDPHLINEACLVENGWLFKIYNRNEALFFKYKHLKDLIHPLNQKQEEFQFIEFIESSCNELVQALDLKIINCNEK